MKKLLLIIFCAVTAFSAKAFVFDGIDLNSDMLQITRQIAAKGYNYDLEKGCLKGTCQGTEIYLSFNTEDTKDKKKIGQLTVEIPVGTSAAEAATALKNASTIFNVIYHRVEGTEAVYAVDVDGTTLNVKTKGGNLILTYNTPYYKAK